MITSDKLKLKLTLADDLEKDFPPDTIVNYSDNFLILEREITKSISDIDNLPVGNYSKGDIYRNANPRINGYVGWVNTKSGAFAPFRKMKRIYKVGDIVTPDTEPKNFTYECVSGGRTHSRPSHFPNESEPFYDVVTSARWTREKSYRTDDFIFSTSGDLTEYYLCVGSGTSGELEPNWAEKPEGTTFTDGTVQWVKYRNIRWKRKEASADFRPYGKIE